jgi:hypothetical protein
MATSAGTVNGNVNASISLAGAHRLGISYSASTLSVLGANGVALGNANPGYVTIPSKTVPGKLLPMTILANQSFIDSTGASTIIGNLFGLTTSVAYNSDIPFYLYGILNDAETILKFAISRVPHRTSSPITANLGCPGTATANTQGSMFIFDTVTLGDYDQNPCIPLGSFRMRMNASNDWAVQALANSDGFGLFNEGTTFNLLVGTFGAATGTFLKANGGTAPTFTTNSWEYNMTRQGRVMASYMMDGDGGTAGAGAVVTAMATPLIPFESIASGGLFIANGSTGLISNNGADLSNGFAAYDSSVAGGSWRFDDNILTNILNSVFIIGQRRIYGKIFYMATIA